MEKSEFETAMNWGKTMLGIGPGIEAADYLTGYMRGLRRRYHGENFGTDAEHEQWIALDEERNHMGNGYRDGFAGIGVAQAQIEFDRAGYCTQMYGNCSMCALVSYGRDCRNNPARARE
jgi:hypothetical protein